MYTVGVLVFKCDKGLAPSYLSDRFVTRSTVHDRNTRNKDYLKSECTEKSSKIGKSWPQLKT